MSKNKILSFLIITSISLTMAAFKKVNPVALYIPKPSDRIFFSEHQRSSLWTELILSMNPEVNISDSLEQISSRVPIQPMFTFTQAYYGAAIRIRCYNIQWLMKFSFIQAIYFCQEDIFPVRDLASISVRADHTWKKLDQKKVPVTGANVNVGIIDTGIDPKHADFSPTGIGPGAKIKIARNIANPNDSMDDFATYPHGTHVAGIIAGNHPDRIKKKGMAPDANLFIYKAFSNDGLLKLPDMLACIEEAINHQADVLNLSLGFSSKFPIPSVAKGDPLYEAISKGIQRGMVICSAAGNSGARQEDNPWPLLAPGIFDNVIQASASDDRMSQVVSVVLEGKKVCTINSISSRNVPRFSDNLSNLPIVDCGFGTLGECTSAEVEGKIALVSRGPESAPISFSEKNIAAKKAGAAGCIIYNFSESGLDGLFSLEDSGSDTQDYIPNIMVSGYFAAQLKRYIQKGATVEFQDNPTAVISDFSSSGPCSSADEMIFKPDICFPGKQINSAVKTYYNRDNHLESPYKDWDGTSMATAGTSGCAALVKQAHPDWSPEDIKTALMNNADLLINPINHEVFPFFNQGAGQINIENTIDTPLLATPSSLIKKVTWNEDVSFAITLKNLTKDELTAEYSLAFFNRPGTTSPFRLADETATSVIPQKTLQEIPLTLINNHQEAMEDKVEGVVWIKVKKSQQTIATLHIPLIFFTSTLLSIQPVIELKSISADRVIPGKLHRISFQLNAGTCQAVNQTPIYLQHAQQIRISIVDNQQNDYGDIFYGENLFIGQYEFKWDGKNTDASEFLPNGKYSLIATITGMNITNRKKELVRNQYHMGSFRFIQSSLPNTPLLVISSVSTIKLNDAFAIELWIDHPENVYKIECGVLFSKNAIQPIQYILNPVLETDRQNPAQITFEDGKIELELFLQKAVQKRTKIATFIFQAERITSSKNGINLSVAKLAMLKLNKKSLVCNYSLPLIRIEKEVLIGDFNKDNTINTIDYDLMIKHFSEDYLSENWDPLYDVNNDLYIDILDVAVFSKYFLVNGETD